MYSFGVDTQKFVYV